MKWSLPIGRIFGISLRLHVTFLIFLAFIAYAGFTDEGLSGAGWAVAMFCSVFACIALHELGHSVVAQELGVQVKSITLLPIGGVAALRSIPENPWHEIAITVAGPMVNVAIACALIPFTGMPSHWLIVDMPRSFHGLLLTLTQANITLFAFNCIPAFPMDGGRLLRAVLALVLPYRQATTIAAMVGQGLAILFVVVGLKISFWLILIGAFIFLGAEGEERVVRMRSALRDLNVQDVMRPGGGNAFALGPGVTRDRVDLSNRTRRFSRARKRYTRWHRGTVETRRGDECAGTQHAGNDDHGDRRIAGVAVGKVGVRV